MTIVDLAQLLSGTLKGAASHEIHGVASLENAGPGDLSFAENEKSLAHAATSRAGCILIPEGASLPAHNTIALRHPKFAFVRATEAILPAIQPASGIHPTAVISEEASLAEDTTVGAYVVIGRGVKVGARTVLDSGVTLGENVEIGSGSRLYPRVIVYPGARIGNRVIVHAGVVIGGDGFGYVFAEGQHHKFPQVGKVIIEDDVEIGCNTTIDRGSLGTTVIGEGTKIDNLCQIAHNVRIGKHCVIAAHSGISGTVDIGDYVVMGGRAGISDHVRIEDGAVIGGGSVVGTGKIIRKGVTVWGMPARPLGEAKKMHAYLASLPRLVEKVRELARKIDQGPGSGSPPAS